MKKLVILVGPPGSGKSTLSKKQYADYVHINQDDHGKGGHLVTFNMALANNLPIIVDRMNFSEEQRQRYVGPARAAGYSIHYHLLFVPRDTCMERMLDRMPDHPTIKTEEDAKSALATFFRFFTYPVLQEGDTITKDHGDEQYVVNAVICDLDGTLCNIDHRLHYVRGEKRDWKSFFENIPGDSINEWCAELLYSLSPAYVIVYCSGRGEETREMTEKWLREADVPMEHLFMRPAKDYRDDSLIKEIILDFEILPRYNILFAVDDRNRVVEMWRRRGIVCLQCQPGDF